MDVYKDIVKDIQIALIEKGKPGVAKKVKKVIDKHLNYLTTGISHNIRYGGIRGSVFLMSIHHLAYLSRSIVKYGLFSNVNPNYIFKIHFKWEKMERNGFMFKPMKKLNYTIKRKALDTDYVYNLIQDYEKYNL